MITIFTPTYNRAYTLKRLYDSLCQQNNKDFEWLIVDDGSTDNTESLLKEFDDRLITIRYYKQVNGGKHRAINKGLSLAHGEWFFIVDSDDYLVSDAIDLSIRYLHEIENQEIYCGIVFNRVYDTGDVIGKKCKYQILNTDFLSYRTKYRGKGDRAEIIKTSVLKNFPFPEFENEKFCPECVVWNRIAREYIARYINKNIYICEYLDDGLSKNIELTRRKSPIGCSLAEYERFYQTNSLKYKLIALGEFWSVYKFVPKGCTYVRPTILLKVLKPLCLLYVPLLKLRRFFN